MSFAAVLGVSLAIGTLIVLGVALVSYMSSLTRSAYELRVEMRRSLDDGLKATEAEVGRQLKWARGELASEIERSRSVLLEDLERRVKEAEARLAEDTAKREAAWVTEREALAATVALLEERLARVEHRLVGRRKPDAEKTEPAAEPAPDTLPEAVPLALQTFQEEVAPMPKPIRAKAR